MALLAIFLGAIVGFSLGLTGGGGAIFAIPLLVYGLAIGPSEAVGISLASVGAMSGLGLAGRWRTGHVEPKTGLIFAAAGMLGTPIGSWAAGQIAPELLLLLFAGLMLVVAARMWIGAHSAAPLLASRPEVDGAGPTCRRDPAGVLKLTSHCAGLLVVVGLGTGILAGLFGVGGGFVIVPALIVFSGMSIHNAVGTSLLVITLVSFAGVASHLLMGRSISLPTTLLFVVGGSTGMALGILASYRLSGAVLQRAFALAIVAVALFVISKSVYQF